MSISSPAPEHPLLTAVRALGTTLDEVAGVDPLFLPSRDKMTLLLELTGLLARVASLRAGVLAVADDVAAQTADRSPGTWLAAEARVDRREAVHDERLGAALRERWSVVAEAVAAGRITWHQAGIIVGALTELVAGEPDLDHELLAKAEAHLVAEAGQFGPLPLRRLARRVLEVVAPDLADRHLARLLEDEERRARATTRLTLRPRGDGTTDLRGRLPSPVANRLVTYLEAFTSPRRTATLGGEVDRLPLSRRRGVAFCALLEHLPQTGLPRHGGTPTQVLVMIDHDTLRSELGSGVAETSTGDQISAGEARRLACSAGIIPRVLGGRSELLDQGRSRRLFSGPLRIALDARDRRCRADGCEIPAAWCEAHHAAKPWAAGGRTSLADGLLLCPHHHHRAHDSAYRAERLPNGDLRFHRRT